MQWADVVRRPSDKLLRQFAGLWLLLFLALAAWRAWSGQPDVWAGLLAGAAVVVGLAGLARPAIVRPVYTGWMMVAFPIGFTVSRLVLMGVFFLVVAPIALVFRAAGRDLLRRRRRPVESYWTEKTMPRAAGEYFRQF